MKPVVWIGSALKDLRTFPRSARQDIGKALYAAQNGETDPAAKSLKGFGGASVLEIVAPYDTDTYRAVYVARFTDAVYVLHTFKKKSKRGVATTKRDVDLIKARLKLARQFSGAGRR